MRLANESLSLSVAVVFLIASCGGNSDAGERVRNSANCFVDQQEKDMAIEAIQEEIVAASSTGATIPDMSNWATDSSIQSWAEQSVLVSAAAAEVAVQTAHDSAAQAAEEEAILIDAQKVAAAVQAAKGSSEADVKAAIDVVEDAEVNALSAALSAALSSVIAHVLIAQEGSQRTLILASIAENESDKDLWEEVSEFSFDSAQEYGQAQVLVNNILEVLEVRMNQNVETERQLEPLWSAFAEIINTIDVAESNLSEVVEEVDAASKSVDLGADEVEMLEETRNHEWEVLSALYIAEQLADEFIEFDRTVETSEIYDPEIVDWASEVSMTEMFDEFEFELEEVPSFESEVFEEADSSPVVTLVAPSDVAQVDSVIAPLLGLTTETAAVDVANQQAELLDATKKLLCQAETSSNFDEEPVLLPETTVDAPLFTTVTTVVDPLLTTVTSVDAPSFTTMTTVASGSTCVDMGYPANWTMTGGGSCIAPVVP